MVRFLGALTILILGTSADLDGCVADLNGIQQCRDAMSTSDATSLLQRTQGAHATATGIEISGEKEPEQLPGAVGLCSPAVVQQACGEIAGASNRTEVYLEELADAFGTDAASSEAFLTSLGFEFSGKIGVKCDDLCSHVLQAFPKAQRPPSCDVAAHRTDSGYAWDIDLSPEALALVHIPEQPPDNGTAGTPGAEPFLLQVQDMPEKYTPLPMDTVEMTAEVAETFRMYPASEPPATPKAEASLSTVSSEVSSEDSSAISCGREAIWGSGQQYKGCQTQTRSGKTCIRWTKGPQIKTTDSNWKIADHSNWCRNPDSSPTIWCWHGTSLSDWEHCDPKGAPKDFAKVAAEASLIAEAWLTNAISKWDANHLPHGYETWLGPSEADAVYGRTVDGCACQKEWTHSGKQIADYCGNPNNDPNGDWCPLQNKNCRSLMLKAKTKDKGCACQSKCANTDKDPNGKWCFVEDQSCQGKNYGYCGEPKTTKAGKAIGYCAKPKTAKGCACKKEWKFKGKVVNHCGNPDNDSGGNWCMVEDKSCQGAGANDNWGYCKKPCGDSCKNVRQLLETTRKTLKTIGFEYNSKKTKGVYAYVSVTGSKQDGTFQVPSTKGIEKGSLTKQHGEKYVMKKKTTASDYVEGHAIMTMCPTWWKLCGSDIAKCKASNKNKFGTLVGTIVHETMHHFPVGADDYLYYRSNIKQWVKANRLNKNAMTLAKDCADCLEYFVEDINGFTETGR